MRAQWQARLGAPGERVEGLTELAQSLSIVLRTPLGSVPGRPTFGSRIHELVDADISDVQAFGPRYARESILVCLPRIQFVDATAELLAPNNAELVVSWRPVGGALQTTRVPVS